MPQNDFIIANQSTPNFRSDLNNALQALATSSSGSAAPSVTYANQLWYDTANNILKIRNEADSAWIDLFDLNQGAGTSAPSNLNVLDEDNFASNSATRPPSQQSTKAYVDALPFTQEYFSSGQTFLAGGGLTLAHGLSSRPKFVMGELYCTTAEGGYSVNDIVPIPPNSKPAGGNSYGFTSVLDATNITVRFGVNGIIVLRKDNGGDEILSPSNWLFYVRAFA